MFDRAVVADVVHDLTGHFTAGGETVLVDGGVVLAGGDLYYG